MNIYATSSDRKRKRQAALLQAVRKESLGTQEELVKALKRHGIKATQVSVSRDIAELRLSKAGGRYQAGSPESSVSDPEFPFRAWVREAVPAGPNLLVLSCEVGTAQRVGLSIDRMQMPEAVGTIAGDDTVFVALSSSTANQKLLRFFRGQIEHEKEI